MLKVIQDGRRQKINFILEQICWNKKYSKCFKSLFQIFFFFDKTQNWQSYGEKTVLA